MTPEPEETVPVVKSYDGIQTILLDDDLVSFRLGITGGRVEDLEAYARCAGLNMRRSAAMATHDTSAPMWCAT